MSLHIVINGRERALVAADSRAGFRNGEVFDNYDKLFVAGARTVCGVEGVLSYVETGQRHDQGVILRRVAAVCGKKSDSPRELLEALRDELQSDLARIISEEPGILFSAIAFEKTPGGAASLFELEFLIRENLQMAPPTIKAIAECCNRRFAYSLGHGDCLTAGLELSCNPDSLSEEAALQAVDHIFAAAARESGQCRDEIGGPVDVLALDQAGIRWLRKKPEESIVTQICRSIPALRAYGRSRK